MHDILLDFDINLFLKFITAAHCVIDSLDYKYNGTTRTYKLNKTDPSFTKYYKAYLGVHNRRYLNDFSKLEVPISKIIIVNYYCKFNTFEIYLLLIFKHIASKL